MPAAEFIPSFRALFSHLLYPDYADPGLPWVINYIREYHPSLECEPDRNPVSRLPEKTQKSGRQKINIRHLPIALEDKKGQRKIIINSR
jgi:hypothetical protein